MTEKDLLDAQEIIEIYKKTPVDKRPILTAAFNAFLAGAEAQELSNGEMAAKMTTHYCGYVETYMDAAPPSEERLEAVQQGIRTLNHISVTLERLRRALQETAPAEAKD